MKKIKTNKPIEAAQGLITHVAERRRKQLGLTATDDNRAIISQLDANQYQLFRKLLKGNRNPTFSKLIELANAIDPTANITITVE
jgi:hypothetical protein